MSFATKRVSDKAIVVPRIPKDNREVKGSDWIPIPYPNCAFIANRGSGKTCAMINLIEHRMGSKTKIIICSPTLELDDTWITVISRWRKKGYAVETFSSIIDEQDGSNWVETFLSDKNTEEKQDIKDKPIVNQPRRSSSLMFNGSLPANMPMRSLPPAENIAHQEKPTRVAKLTPEYILVFDDCGESLRNKALAQLLKTSRHYHTMVVIATQSLNDLMPQQVTQLQYVFIFSKFPEKKLEELYEKLRCTIPYEKFAALYADATQKPYSFLYIGRESSGDVFRKNFTDQYLL